MRIAVFALVLFALLSACALAVTFGEPDLGRHPYVGTLLFQTGTGWYSCSGTLIAPTVVLTAGHCTKEGGFPNVNTFVKFTPSISLADRPEGVSLLSYLENSKNGWVKGTAIAHPLYDDYAQFPRTYDVGVVLLAKPVKLSTHGELPPEGFLQTLTATSSQTDNRFTLVGYGMQGVIRPFASDIWERYQGTVRLIELNSANTGGQSAKFTNNPGLGGGSCYGDSGGPIFYGNTNMITAVVSWGITPCIGNSYEFRIDTAVALDFIRRCLSGGCSARH
jgi:secreted trypsin-like serine protease